MSSRHSHPLSIAVGKRIRNLRLKKGWSQTDLAVHLDLSRTHISDLECGMREVCLITLQVIARGLGTTMAKLLRGL